MALTSKFNVIIISLYLPKRSQVERKLLRGENPRSNTLGRAISHTGCMDMASTTCTLQNIGLTRDTRNIQYMYI
jgi:hypothetical protein